MILDQLPLVEEDLEDSSNKLVKPPCSDFNKENPHVSALKEN